MSRPGAPPQDRAWPWASAKSRMSSPRILSCPCTSTPIAPNPNPDPSSNPYSRLSWTLTVILTPFVTKVLALALIPHLFSNPTSISILIFSLYLSPHPTGMRVWASWSLTRSLSMNASLGLLEPDPKLKHERRRPCTHTPKPKPTLRPSSNSNLNHDPNPNPSRTGTLNPCRTPMRLQPNT